ncbi:class I SAM-dependent methyltransferase [bacterium]|nr:class I SAM-dependent methyltransferase [bacterium]
MPEFINPIEILNQIGLRPDMVAADFGCGAGGWVIPLAKILKDGRVYAIDVQEEPLSALEGKLKMFDIKNVVTVRSDVEKVGGSKIPEGSCDIVLMVNLLFQVDDKGEVFKEAKRILKENGRVLVVDWLKNAPLGPVEGRVLPEEVKKIAQENGFRAERESKAGNFHYLLYFTKSE